MALKLAAAVAALAPFGATAFEANLRVQPVLTQQSTGPTSLRGQTLKSSADTGASGAASWARVGVGAAVLACAAARVANRRSPAAAAARRVQTGLVATSVNDAEGCFAGVQKPAETRGSAIVAHAETKRGMYAVYKRRDMWLKYSRTFKGRQRNVHRIAKNAVIDALKKKYKSRRLFKRERRTLWIQRVRANCRLHGIRYSDFISKLKVQNVNLNRKIMSQLAIYDRPVFTNIMEVAVPDWKEIKARKFWKKPDYTVDEIDDLTIPYIEKTVPELYTDDTIRFNRQVKEWGVEYTVDMGEPEVWREVLPKMPELANFNLPDHWCGNANAEFEAIPLGLLQVKEGEESEDYLKFQKMVKATQEQDAAAEERGEKTWPKKEGVSREDWFSEEPQTWF